MPELDLLTIGRVLGRPLRRRARRRVRRRRSGSRSRSAARPRTSPSPPPGSGTAPRCSRRSATTRSATTSSPSSRRFGVDTAFVGRHPTLRTPLAFAALDAARGPAAALLPRAGGARHAARARRRRRRRGRATSTCSGSPARRWPRSRRARRSSALLERPRSAAGTPSSTSTTGRCCGRARPRRRP